MTVNRDLFVSNSLDLSALRTYPQFNSATNLSSSLSDVVQFNTQARRAANTDGGGTLTLNLVDIEGAYIQGDLDDLVALPGNDLDSFVYIGGGDRGGGRYFLDKTGNAFYARNFRLNANGTIVNVEVPARMDVLGSKVNDNLDVADLLNINMGVREDGVVQLVDFASAMKVGTLTYQSNGYYSGPADSVTTIITGSTVQFSVRLVGGILGEGPYVLTGTLSSSSSDTAIGIFYSQRGFEFQVKLIEKTLFVSYQPRSLVREPEQGLVQNVMVDRSFDCPHYDTSLAVDGNVFVGWGSDVAQLYMNDNEEVKVNYRGQNLNYLSEEHLRQQPRQVVEFTSAGALTTDAFTRRYNWYVNGLIDEEYDCVVAHGFTLEEGNIKVKRFDEQVIICMQNDQKFALQQFSNIQTDDKISRNCFLKDEEWFVVTYPNETDYASVVKIEPVLADAPFKPYFSVTSNSKVYHLDRAMERYYTTSMYRISNDILYAVAVTNSSEKYIQETNFST